MKEMNAREICDALARNAERRALTEAALRGEGKERARLLAQTVGKIPMHEAAKAAGITRESAWRLIRGTKEGK